MLRGLLFISLLVPMAAMAQSSPGPGGLGISLVTDGTTTVTGTRQLVFTNGATVTSGGTGTGIVDVSISGGTGCTLGAGASGLLVVANGSSGCQLNTHASAVNGGLTLGSAGFGGSLTLDGSSSGSAVLSGGTNGTFTSASPWALSGVFSLTGVSNTLGTPSSLTLTNANGLPLSSGVTGILPGTNGGTGVNNGSNTISTSLPFAITGSGAQTFFFGNSGVPWTYNFPQVSGNLAYQVGSIVSGHCLQASGTAGGITDAGAVCGSGGSGVTFADGSHTVTGATQLTVTGGVIGGTSPNATLTISASAASFTPGTTTILGATAPCTLANTSANVSGCIPMGGVRTVTTSPTILSTDLNGEIVMNVTGGGTLTVPATSTFTANTSVTVVNYSASTAAVSTTPTINAGGGCVSGTGIPAGDTWWMTSNGTTIDCIQTVSASTGSGVTTVSPSTPNLLISGTTISTQNLVVSSAANPYVLNGTGTGGTGAAIDNTKTLELSGGAVTLGTGGATGFAAGVGGAIVPSVATTVSAATGTVAGQTSVTAAPNQYIAFGSDGSTDWKLALGMPPSCTQNQVIASPNGSTGQPKCRALVTADIPTGTSGGAIPLLNGNNTESGNNSHTGTETFGTVIGGVNTQSGTTYTLQASDCGKTVVATNASAITVTTFQAAVVGCTIAVEQGGAGQVTFSNGGSATLVSAHSYTKTFNAKGATVSLFVDVNGGSAAEFILSGDGA